MSKELLTAMENAGFCDYGSVIPGQFVRNVIGLSYPEVATKAVFDQLALAELSAVDYVRNVLLGRGMYLTYVRGNYRILLPSENVKQVESYINSADSKLSRALKLSKNTPKMVDTYQHNDQTHARILMKRNGLRRSV
ncbi:MAG: hypothetical protein WAV01_02115 [Candidatus Saccharimonadales bacterium]